MGALDLELSEDQQSVLDSLPDDAKGLFADLVSDIAKAAEEAAEAKFAKDEDSDDDDSDDEDDKSGEEDEEMLEKADPAIRRMISKYRDEASQSKKAADAALTLAKAEHEARVDREMLQLAQEFKNLAGTAPEKAVILKAAFAVSDDHGKSIVNMMKAANAQLESAGLFGEVGKGAPGDNTIDGEVEMKAQELRKSNPALTIEKARSLVFESDPTLYDRILGR